MHTWTYILPTSHRMRRIMEGLNGMKARNVLTDILEILLSDNEDTLTTTVLIMTDNDSEFRAMREYYLRIVKIVAEDTDDFQCTVWRELEPGWTPTIRELHYDNRQWCFIIDSILSDWEET